MTATTAPRELSYYLPIMNWNGSRMTFDPDRTRDRLTGLREAGIRWIGVDGINLMEPGDRDYREVARLTGGWLQEFGLRLSSFHYAGPTYAPLDGGQESILRVFRENLDVFGAWRPQSFVVHANWILGENATEATEAAYRREADRHGEDAVLRTVAANLKELARAAAALDIRVALENLSPFFRLCNREMLPRLVAAIDEPNVGYCVDSGHAHMIGESIVDWLRLAGDRLYETHFHDNRGRGVDEHWPVGFGTISWVDVIETLDKIGFPGPVTFETGGWPAADPVQGYREAIAWWRAAERQAASLRVR